MRLLEARTRPERRRGVGDAYADRLPGEGLVEDGRAVLRKAGWANDEPVAKTGLGGHGRRAGVVSVANIRLAF